LMGVVLSWNGFKRTCSHDSTIKLWYMHENKCCQWPMYKSNRWTVTYLDVDFINFIEKALDGRLISSLIVKQHKFDICQSEKWHWLWKYDQFIETRLVLDVRPAVQKAEMERSLNLSTSFRNITFVDQTFWSTISRAEWTINWFKSSFCFDEKTLLGVSCFDGVRIPTHFDSKN
jgi:hypothetical protein